jgi:SAM-dependent methyltransferase
MTAIDQSNIAFWNEICGTSLAKHLGISDCSAASLKKFDDWYLEFYPYLADHIQFADVAGQKVLEIGLGYGTVSQKLIEAGARYHGLDIAHGPVAMVRHRASLLGKAAYLSQGSALTIPYADITFDQVVAIGCLHHTGNLALAMREVHRVLKPGGRAIIMVYNALSYRHWRSAPWKTFQRRRHPDFKWSNADTDLRRIYDANQKGQAAPSTTFVSSKEAHSFLRAHFSAVNVKARNIGDEFLHFFRLSRSIKRSLFESTLGLDLYIECIK